MEDILASIRRIIADDQSRHAPHLKRRFTLPAGPSDEAGSDQDPIAAEVRETAAGDGESGGSSLRAALGQPRPDTGQTQEGSSLREAEQPARVFPLDPDGPSVAAFAAAVPHLNPPVFATDLLPHDPALIEEIARIGAASILRPKPPAMSSAVAAAPPDPVVDLPAQEPVSAGQPTPSAEVEPKVLVSETVVSSVETSFLTLASSVFTQNEGAVERMLHDALQPLLKTWLDDNLPTIVERLVRSEIERVARGVRG